MTGIGIGALGLGWAKGKGYFAKIPKIAESAAVTLGIGGYLAAKKSSSQSIKLAGVAALAVACFDFGIVQGGGTSGIEGDDAGDEGSGEDTTGDDW